MGIEQLGRCDLGVVRRLTLGRAPGPVLEVLDLGATTHALWLTGGDGERRNVLLGHPTVQERLDSTHYLGATVGRYANRIRGGRFTIDGTPHQVGAQDRGNSLHGGPDGFDRRIWEVVEVEEDTATLRLVSPDGDQGYPGEVAAQVTYMVSGTGSTGRVRIELSATTDAATPVNLTNHAYLDLAGEGSGRAMEQVLEVPADTYLQVDPTGIPLPGPPADVAGTPLDLRSPRVLGDAARADHPQVRVVQGIDHTFLVEGTGLRRMAVLESAAARTRMDLRSDQPGLQVYTGNVLDGTVRGTSGRLYRQGDGVALEPQLLPDTPNRPEFGDAVLRPGSTYRSTIEWRFAST